MDNFAEIELNKVADWIANIISPPVVALVGLALVALKENSWAGWQAIGMALAIGFCVPMGYLLWSMRAGRVSDFHIFDRSERIRPMLVSVVAIALVCLVLWVSHAPRLVSVLMTINLLITLTLTITTFWWKISGHSATIASFAMLVWILFGGIYALAVLPLVPVVMWARWYRKKHTFWQTLMGSLLGVVWMTSAMRWLNGFW
ncbi:MAG TPA: hypothetical protein PK299_11505 [Anaerolineales bacterium]|nr:hypothetical protein [Anaerolineales bacterium]